MTAKLLIVDDDPATIRLLNASVRGLGEVFFATDGPAAFRLAHEQRPDIVLLDLQLPGMDGFAVCAALKADPATAGAAILFITADTDRATEQRAFGMGAADFIHKPIGSVAVRARVRNQLAMRAHRNTDARTDSGGENGAGVAAGAGPAGDVKVLRQRGDQEEPAARFAQDV